MASLQVSVQMVGQRRGVFSDYSDRSGDSH